MENRLEGFGRARMAWAWGLLALLMGLWLVPSARVQAQEAWVHVGGPEGGTIHALAADRSVPGTVYAAVEGGGVRKSTDGGASWSGANNGLPSAATVHALALDPAAPGTVYAGTRIGLYKSVDGGASWTGMGNGLPDAVWVNALALDSSRPGTVYAGTYYYGIFKSTDGGVSWAVANNGISRFLPPVNQLIVDPAAPGAVYAGFQGAGVYKSTDSGASWMAINGQLENLNVGALALDRAAPGTLYAGTVSGIFKSTDDGVSWHALNSGVPSNRDINSLVSDPLVPGTVYAGTHNGIFKSTDGGVSWVAIRSDFMATPVNALVLDPVAPGTVYAGVESSGIFKSRDGGASWQAINNGLAYTPVVALVFDPNVSGTMYARSPAGRIYKSADHGVSWSTIYGGPSPVRTFVPDPGVPGTLYAGTHEGVLKSRDGGATWVAVNSGLTGYFDTLAVDPNAPGTVYAQRLGAVFKSTNGGASWAMVYRASDAERNLWADTGLAIDYSAPGTVYAVNSNGLIKSTDGGASWKIMYAPGGVTSSLKLDFQSPKTLYVVDYHFIIGGTYSEWFKSTDGGNSWQPTSSWPATAHPTASGVKVTARQAVLLKSSDNGITWAALGSGIPPDAQINSFAFDPAAPFAVYAGTNKGGLYKLSAIPLPDSGEPVSLSLPSGGSITTSSRQAGTLVQLVRTDSGATVASVVAGSALLQHSMASRPLAGLPRSGAMAVLTPSCAAARMVVTATGDTHTAFDEGCGMALSNAGAAQPEPTQGVTVPSGSLRADDVQLYVTGPVTQRSVLARMSLAALPAGAQHFDVYLLALMPHYVTGLLNTVFIQKLPTGAWGVMDGPMLPLVSQASASATGGHVVVEALRDTDLRALHGVELYIGYGTDSQEMLQAQRYRALYVNP